MRILIPILAVVLGIAFVLAIPSLNRQASPTSDGGLPSAVDTATGLASGDPPQLFDQVPSAPVGSMPDPSPVGTENEMQEPVASLGALQVLPFDGSANGYLGSLDPGQGYRMQVATYRFGAGIRRIQLTDYKVTALKDVPYTIQAKLEVGGDPTVSGTAKVRRYPFAIRTVTINGQSLGVESAPWQMIEGSPNDGRAGSEVVYELTIADTDASPVLKLRRSFSLAPDSYQIRVRLNLQNQREGLLEVVIDQSGQVDLPVGTATYMGDKRATVMGYFNREYDPKRRLIFTDSANTPRSKILKDLLSGRSTVPLWPDPELPRGVELAWLGAISRYFTVVVHPLVDPFASGPTPGLETQFLSAGSDVHGSDSVASNGGVDPRVLIHHLRSRPIRLARQDAAADLDYGIFAGPRKRQLFAAEPYKTLQFGDNLIIYSLGGMCTFCTFQWLAKLLLGFMTMIHFVLQDWGLAIIVLVLCVRFVLHPITKKSQIQISKFQKQFAALQPEIEKLKKKYGDNQKKIQQEQMKLFREKGINPMNMLGCLPMFLQMPIWIALYAMLFLAIELRHQPAFYGVFQWLGTLFTGEPWAFLSDLSESDKFIRFSEGGFYLPFCPSVYIPYALNILPILMGIFFFFQTKLMSAPPANEQARQQQRIMSIMMVTMFPLMLYPAPSGLTLYIMASSIAGMIDSLIVRKHIKQMEADGTLFEKKKGKSGGFMERFQEAMAQRQKSMSTNRPYKSRK